MDATDTALSRLRGIQRHLPGHSTACPTAEAQPTRTSTAAQAVLDTRRRVPLLDSWISYLDTGAVGDNAVIFLHGNPTSAFLWRNIIPHVRPLARCLAPDLIGMGRSGKEPNNSYRFADHYRYLSAWFEAVNLPQKVTIVCHDWGSALGFHWSNMHRDRVQALVFAEAVVSTVPEWDFFPDRWAQFFKDLRTDAGEEMNLKNNDFIEKYLVGEIMRTLTEDEMAEYRRPYLTPGESRRPTLTWPREIPIEGEPEDVSNIVYDYYPWLSESDIPKLFIEADPGLFSSLGMSVLVGDWKNVAMVKVRGRHFLQEDSPDEIGQAIANFLKSKVY